MNPANHHSIILTAPYSAADRPLAQRLVEVNIDTIALCPAADVATNRLRQVTTACLEHDICVFWHHSYDAVAAAAMHFCRKKGIPTVIYRHCSHAFGLGAAAASCVADFTDRNVELTLKHFPGARPVLVPFKAHSDQPSRFAQSYAKALRCQLNIVESECVLVTVASERTLLDVPTNPLLLAFRELCSGSGNIRLLVGSSSPRLAQEIKRAFPEVDVLVTKDWLEPLQALADIYLDTMPYGGGLTAFDFAAKGVPVVYGFHVEDTETTAATRCLVGVPEDLKPGSRSDYEQVIESLVADPELRRTLGAQCKMATLMNHSAGVVEDAISSAYGVALSARKGEEGVATSVTLWNEAQQAMAARQIARSRSEVRRLIWFITLREAVQSPFVVAWRVWRRLRSVALADLRTAVGLVRQAVFSATAIKEG